MTDRSPEIEWRPIPLWPEYEISRDGQVRNTETKRIRKPRMVKLAGGPTAAIELRRQGGKNTTRMVHRLVKEAWGG